MSARDSQRSKVYAAERASGIFVMSRVSLQPMSIAECSKLVRKILASSYTRRKYGEKRVDALAQRLQVVPTHGGGRAGYYDDWKQNSTVPQIRLGVWARQEAIVIHELAHWLAGLDHNHDWHFCEVYLDLVRHFMGREAHDKLKASFKARKVRFTAPRPKREISPEQREALVARLAAARAAKAAKEAAAA